MSEPEGSRAGPERLPASESGSREAADTPAAADSDAGTPPPPEAGSRRRSWLRIARLAYLALLAVVVAWLLAGRSDDLGRLASEAQPGLLVLALAVGFLQLGLNAAFWNATLRALDQHAGYGAVLDASTRSLLARYIPGSVWYAVGRSVVLARAGVAKRALGTVAVVEVALSIVVGTAMGVGVLLATGRLPGGLGWLAAWVTACLLVSSPPVVNRGLALVARRRGGPVVRIPWWRYPVLLGWMAAFWVSAATMFTLYLHAFPAAVTRPPLEIAGSFMVAWVIGALALFAPQGIGVFEAAVAALLATDGIAGVALVVAGYRALTLVRDVIALGVGELSRSVRARPPS